MDIYINNTISQNTYICDGCGNGLKKGDNIVAMEFDVTGQLTILCLDCAKSFKDEYNEALSNMEVGQV